MARGILRRLKFDNDTTRKVCALVGSHDRASGGRSGERAPAMVDIGLEAFPRLFALKRADVMAQGCYRRREKLRGIEDFERLYREILDQGQCLSLRELKVGGADLIAMGAKQGTMIGDVSPSSGLGAGGPGEEPERSAFGGGRPVPYKYLKLQGLRRAAPVHRR